MTHLAHPTVAPTVKYLLAETDRDIQVRVSPHLRGSNWQGRLLAGVCLLLSCPFLLILMALVRLTSRGPALYVQNRVGQNGRIFAMYKLRSMVHNAEAVTGPTWAERDDPRITLFGRVLRATHLDELPQLINVVRGEMAIFGPRPERPEIVRSLVNQVPQYWNRLAVLPGITGLAQINLPPDETVECVRRKLKLDLEYIETAHWSLDVRMFFWTLMRLVMIPAGVATRLMGVQRRVIDPLDDLLEDPDDDPASDATVSAGDDTDVAAMQPHVHPAETPAQVGYRRHPR